MAVTPLASSPCLSVEGDDNNQCTEENKGCECARKCETEPEKVPFCDECGGDAGGNKCNGMEEKNGLWKDCTCYVFDDDIMPLPGMDPDEAKDAQDKIDAYVVPDH